MMIIKVPSFVNQFYKFLEPKERGNLNPSEKTANFDSGTSIIIKQRASCLPSYLEASFLRPNGLPPENRTTQLFLACSNLNGYTKGQIVYLQFESKA
jgi:hypothetical protein